MLNKATVDAIAKALGIDAEVLATGISQETEANITIPTGTFLTTEARATLEDNLGKSGYDRGATAGREIALKDMSKAVGFDETIKDTSKFIESYKAKILEEAQVEPNEKIQSLETTIESLRGKIEEKDTAYSTLQTDIKQREIKTNVLNNIPDMPEALGLSKEDALSLFFNNFEIKDDGVYKNGELVVDDVHKALGVDDVVNSWVTEKGWNKPVTNDPKGRGGKGTPPGTALPKSYEDYQSELKSRGWSEASSEGQALLADIAKEHPEVLD